jgi:DNA-binding MarR family transcriptional regulator
MSKSRIKKSDSSPGGRLAGARRVEKANTSRAGPEIEAATAGPSRQELLARLWDLGRIMSTQTVFLHQAIAQSVGLNATDTKCIDLILRSPSQTTTAGNLSEMTGLTTGAITHILDRLEKRGFIERVRDTDDRRKIFIRVRSEKLEPLIPKFEQIGQAFMGLMEQYNDDELRLICQYTEKTSEMSQRELRRLIERNQAKKPAD